MAGLAWGLPVGNASRDDRSMLGVLVITIHVMEVVAALIVLFIVLLVRIARRMEQPREEVRPAAVRRASAWPSAGMGDEAIGRRAGVR